MSALRCVGTRRLRDTADVLATFGIARGLASLMTLEPTMTTEPSVSCTTRSASRAAGSDLAVSRSFIGCAN